MKKLGMKRWGLVVLLVGAVLSLGMAPLADGYVCPPCSADCHNEVYDKPGTCPTCGMALELKAGATPNATTADPANYPDLTAEAFCDRIEQNPEIVLLDVRSEGEFTDSSGPGRLKNALNIPVQELESRLSELDEYKGREIVTYCSHSIRSPRAARLLQDNGFSEAKNLLSGMSRLSQESEETFPCKAVVYEVPE